MSRAKPGVSKFRLADTLGNYVRHPTEQQRCELAEWIPFIHEQCTNRSLAAAVHVAGPSSRSRLPRPARLRDTGLKRASHSCGASGSATRAEDEEGAAGSDTLAPRTSRAAGRRNSPDLWGPRNICETYQNRLKHIKTW